jgi:tetratricopeptide (TPR) repeat protein
LLQVARLESRSDPRRALETVERAIALEPASVDAHDLRATLAVRAGDRELALAACAPEALRARLPVPLRGRRAWVLAELGDRGAAIASMADVVAERPDYAFGQRCLADWAEAAGDRPLALRAARALVRIEPTAAVSHGYLGAALADSGERAEALRSFARALELDPSYGYALHRSVALRLEQRDLDGARAAIEGCASFVPDEDVLLLRLEVAAASRDANALEPALRAVLACESFSGAYFERAVGALTGGDARAAEDVALRLASEAGASRRAGRAWAAARLGRGRAVRGRAVARIARASPAAATGALERYVEHLEERGSVLSVLAVALLHRRTARADEELAGSIGHALLQKGHALACALWLAGRARPGSKPWVRLNLTAALRRLGLRRAAVAVSRRALSLPEDHATPLHRAWLALEAAVAGREGEAAELLARDDGRTLPAYFANVRKLAAAIVELRAAPREARSGAWRRARAAFDEVAPSRLFGAFSLERGPWRRTARAIGRAGRSVASIGWGYGETGAAWCQWLAMPMLLTPLGFGVVVVGLTGGVALGLALRVVRSLAR